MVQSRRMDDMEVQVEHALDAGTDDLMRWRIDLHTRAAHVANDSSPRFSYPPPNACVRFLHVFNQEIHFLFSMEDSRDAFKIPHDLKIFKEVFSCERATRENDFWRAYDLPKVTVTTTSSERSGTRYLLLRA